THQIIVTKEKATASYLSTGTDVKGLVVFRSPVIYTCREPIGFTQVLRINQTAAGVAELV
ncbi:MAG TPA: hypothetical protein DGR97_05505, partial [Gammaproteobacteria bacterium]|nr:hypothetical protein [Gammaproteobacteria bacterium]